MDTSVYISYTNVSGWIGLLILALLCYTDFRKNIIKSNRSLMYWGAFVFFIFINCFIYFALLNVVAGINFHVAQGLFHYVGDSNGSGSNAIFQYRIFSPILIALLYFGTGAAKFKYKNKEFSIYERILSLFRTMFKDIQGTQEKIEIHLKQLGEETEKLRIKVEELQEIADENEWDMYKPEWKRIDNEAQLYGKHIDLLTDIRGQLAQNPMDQMTINNIRSTIESENEKIRLGINKRIRQYIRKVLMGNIRGESSLGTIAKFLEVNIEKIVDEPEPNNISRVAALSLIGGITLSITFQFLNYFDLKETMASTGVLPPFELQYLSMIYLSLSMFVFLVFFTFISKTKPDLKGVCNSILLGASGGFLGHLTYKLVAETSALFSGQSFLMINMNEFVDCMWGLLLGIPSALVCYLFFHHSNQVLSRAALRYASMALVGGVLYWGIYVLLRHNLDFIGLNIFDHLEGFLLGVIVLSCITFVSGAIEERN